MIEDRLRTLFHWVSERERIRLGKAEGYVTDDPVLREYRFCNVQREHDRVTVWVREHIREPYADHPQLWLALAAARFINWPPAIQELMDSPGAWPTHDGYRPELMTAVLEQRRRRGYKVETGAYMIRAPSSPTEPWFSYTKQRYVAEVVLGKLWERRDCWIARLEPPETCRCQTDAGFASAAAYNGGCSDCQGTGFLGYPNTLQGVWSILQDSYYTGWGPFMSYQWIIDMRWTRYLRDAPDIQTWSALGPGSRRGLNRLHGRPVAAPLPQARGCAEMMALRTRIAEAIKAGEVASWVALPDLSDVQNALCEYDKYTRVLGGEGRPRARYVPGRGY